MSPEFLDMLGFTAAKAKELGLQMDLTLGSGWPYGGPMFTREEAVQSLANGGVVTIEPGQTSVAPGAGGARGARGGRGNGEHAHARRVVSGVDLLPGGPGLAQNRERLSRIAFGQPHRPARLCGQRRQCRRIELARE